MFAPSCDASERVSCCGPTGRSGQLGREVGPGAPTQLHVTAKLWESLDVTELAPTAFVISPIGKAGTPEYRRHKLTLDYIIRKALPESEWRVVRADDESAPDSITSQVIERIVHSELIVAVLTDANPNVFYELAVAHGMKKPVVHLLQEGQSMPFDVGDQRAIFYELEDPQSVDSAIQQLSASVGWVRENPTRIRNPLTSYAQFELIASSDAQADGGEAVAAALRDVSDRLRAIERSQDQLVPLGGPDGFGLGNPTVSLFRGRLSPTTEALILNSELVGNKQGERVIKVQIGARHHPSSKQLAELEAVARSLDCQLMIQFSDPFAGGGK